MKKLILALVAIVSAIAINAKTLVVYYSYTNNVAINVDFIHHKSGRQKHQNQTLKCYEQDSISIIDPYNHK